MISLLTAIIISASIDSTQLALGDQTNMHIQVTQDAAEQVLRPNFAAQLPQGMESVKEGKIDTTDLGGGKIQWSQDLTLTGYMDTTFTIRPYIMTLQDDSLFAQPMQITILFPEDLEQKEYYDIQEIEDVPIWWWDIVKWVLIGLAAVILCGVIAFIIILTTRRKKGRTILRKRVVILRPAEEVALEKLGIIRDKKIWQQGYSKQYHTDLTDVIREYIGRRYDVHSTEKTSDETLRAMRPLLSKELYVQLSKMLQLADLVKFAKFEPLPNEHEEALDIAYEFVIETTPKPEKTEKPEKPEKTVKS